MARSEETATRDPSLDDLSVQIASLKADVLAITETLTALTKSGAASFAEATRDEAQALRDRGEARLADLHDRTAGLGQEAQRLLRENPSTALGIAAGAGFLAGILLTRR